MSCTSAATAAAAAAAVMCCILGLVCAGPLPQVCDSGCRTTTTERHGLPFSHVLELQNKSIAPWTLKPSHFNKAIQEADCHECPHPCLKSEAIHVQVFLTQSMRNHTSGSRTYCLCSYKLAVGCTCVQRKNCAFRSQMSS